MKPVENPDKEFSHWYDEELHQPISPEEYHQALINEMQLQVGDVYEVEGETHEVVTIDVKSETIAVEDPKRSHPQDARVGTWNISILDLYRDWRQGKAVPATMKISTNA